MNLLMVSIRPIYLVLALACVMAVGLAQLVADNGPSCGQCPSAGATKAPATAPTTKPVAQLKLCNLCGEMVSEPCSDYCKDAQKAVAAKTAPSGCPLAVASTTRPANAGCCPSGAATCPSDNKPK